MFAKKERIALHSTDILLTFLYKIWSRSWNRIQWDYCFGKSKQIHEIISEKKCEGGIALTYFLNAKPTQQ